MNLIFKKTEDTKSRESIDNEFDLKMTEDTKSRKSIKYINENPQNVVVFKIVFSIHIVFSINRKSSVLSNLSKNPLLLLWILK